MKNTDKLSFGDIVLADCTFSDGMGSKLRPVLFLFTDQQDYVILKITSQEDIYDKNTIVIEPEKENNIQARSYIKVKKITTFHKTLFTRKIGCTSSRQKEDIRAMLKNIINKL